MASAAKIEYLSQSFESWKAQLDMMDAMLAAAVSVANPSPNAFRCVVDEWKTVLLLQRVRLEEAFESSLAALQTGTGLADTAPLGLQLADSLKWSRLFCALAADLQKHQPATKPSPTTTQQTPITPQPSNSSSLSSPSSSLSTEKQQQQQSMSQRPGSSSSDEDFEQLDGEDDTHSLNTGVSCPVDEFVVCVEPQLVQKTVSAASQPSDLKKRPLKKNKSPVDEEDGDLALVDSEDEWASSSSSSSASTADSNFEQVEILLTEPPSSPPPPSKTAATGTETVEIPKPAGEDQSVQTLPPSMIKSSVTTVATAAAAGVACQTARVPPSQHDLKFVRDRIMARFQLHQRFGHHLSRDTVTEVMRRGVERDPGFVNRPLPHIYETVKVLLPLALESAKSKYQAPQVNSKLLAQWTFKTKLCLPYSVQAGKCPNGSQCPYAHGEAELRPKRRVALCHQWEERGFCPRRAVCLYAHGKNELGQEIR